MGGKPKPTIEFIKLFIQQKHPGSFCLEDIYIDNETKIKWQCENGCQFYACWASIYNNNTWCPYCAKRKYSINDIKTYIQQHHPNAICLSTRYKNNLEKLSIQCENKHIFQISKNKLFAGQWCGFCHKEKFDIPIEQIQKIIGIKHPGAICLNDKYSSQLKIQCENKHIFITRLISIKNGHWCPICWKEKRCRYTIEDFINILHEKHPNAKCLSHTFNGTRKDMNVECENGHLWQISLYNLLKNYQCPKCKELIQTSIQSIQDFLDKEAPNTKVLDDKYINQNIKLTLQCDCGNIYKSKWSSLQNKHFCPLCRKRKVPTIAFIQKFIDQNFPNGKCLETEYISATSKMKFLCDNKHEFKRSWDELLSKHRWCPICNPIISYDIDYVKEYIKKEKNAECLSDVYINNKTPLKIKCEYGHIFEMSWGRINNGKHWCPECISAMLFGESCCRYAFETLFKSKFEKIRPSWLQRDPIHKNTRHELDGYCSSLNIAFEYQGRHHYDEMNGRERLEVIQRRDKYKKQRCQELKIKLIEIPYFNRNFTCNNLRCFIKDKCVAMNITLPDDFDIIELDFRKAKIEKK